MALSASFMVRTRLHALAQLVRSRCGDEIAGLEPALDDDGVAGQLTELDGDPVHLHGAAVDAPDRGGAAGIDHGRARRDGDTGVKLIGGGTHPDQRGHPGEDQDLGRRVEGERGLEGAGRRVGRGGELLEAGGEHGVRRQRRDRDHRFQQTVQSPQIDRATDSQQRGLGDRDVDLEVQVVLQQQDGLFRLDVLEALDVLAGDPPCERREEVGVGEVLLHDPQIRLGHLPVPLARLEVAL
jgi:hypothetical protein